MAKSQIEVELKSKYDGEGFRKLDNDLKNAGQQTRRASEGLNKIASSLGGVDNSATKALGTMSSLLGTLASFGLKGLVFGAITAGIQKVISRFREMEETVKTVGNTFRTYLTTAFIDTEKRADSLLKKLKNLELEQKHQSDVKTINREADYKVRQSNINLKYDRQKAVARTQEEKDSVELGRRRELLEARKDYEGIKAKDQTEDTGKKISQNEEKIRELQKQKERLENSLKPAQQAEAQAQQIRDEMVVLGRKIDVATEKNNLARGNVENSSVSEYMTAEEKKQIYDERVKNPLEALWDSVKFWENDKDFQNGSMVGKKVVTERDEEGNLNTKVVREDKGKNKDQTEMPPIYQDVVQVLKEAKINNPESLVQKIFQNLQKANIEKPEDLEQNIIQTLEKAKISNPEDLFQRIIQKFEKADSEKPEDLEQNIIQILKAAKIEKPEDLSQKIIQNLQEAKIENPEDLKQNIIQTLEKANIQNPESLIQPIVQVLKEAKIPQVKDQTQAITQNVNKAEIQPVQDLEQNVIQILKESQIENPEDLSQTIIQNLKKAEIKSPEDMKQNIIQTLTEAKIDNPEELLQRIIQILEKVDISKPNDLTQTITQILREAKIDAPEDLTQTIVQNVEKAQTANPQDLIQVVSQMLEKAKVENPETIVQHIVQVLEKSFIPKVEDQTQNITQNVKETPIGKVEDQEQTITQILKEAKIEDVKDLVQKIVQIVEKEDSEKPEDLEQKIVQILEKANIKNPEQLSQNIVQKVLGAEIPEAKDQEQTITQNIEETKAENPQGLTQTITQILKEAKIEKPEDLTQTIVENIKKANTDKPEDLEQTIRQVLEEVKSDNPENLMQLIVQKIVEAKQTPVESQTQTVVQEVKEAEIEKPEDLSQTIVRIFQGAVIPEVKDQTYTTTQEVKTSEIPTVRDQTQTIEQILKKAEIEKPEDLSQKIVQSIQKAEIKTPEDLIQTIRQVFESQKIEAPKDVVQEIKRVYHDDTNDRNPVARAWDGVTNGIEEISHDEELANVQRILHTEALLNGAQPAAELGNKMLDKTTERQWLKFEEQRRKTIQNRNNLWSKHGGTFEPAKYDIASKEYTNTLLEWNKAGRTDIGGEDFVRRYKELGGKEGKMLNLRSGAGGKNISEVIHDFTNDKEVMKEYEKLGKTAQKTFKPKKIIGTPRLEPISGEAARNERTLQGFNSASNPHGKQLKDVDTIAGKGKRLVEGVKNSRAAQAFGKVLKSPVGKVAGKALAGAAVVDAGISGVKVGYETERWIEQLGEESDTGKLAEKYEEMKKRMERLESQYKGNAQVEREKKLLEQVKKELEDALQKRKTIQTESMKNDADRRVSQAEISREEFNLMTDEEKEDSLRPVTEGEGSNLKIDRTSMENYAKATPQTEKEELYGQKMRLEQYSSQMENSEIQHEEKLEQGEREQKISTLNKDKRKIETDYIRDLKKMLQDNLKTVAQMSKVEYSKLDFDKINNALDVESLKSANDDVIAAMERAANAWQNMANQVGNLNLPQAQQQQQQQNNEAKKDADKRIKNIANAAGQRAALANRIFDDKGRIRKGASEKDIDEFQKTTDYMDQAMGQEMTDKQREQTQSTKDRLAKLVLDKNGNIKKSANMQNVRQYLAAKGMLDNEGKAKKAVEDAKKEAEAAKAEKERREQENNLNLRMIKDKLDNLGL